MIGVDQVHLRAAEGSDPSLWGDCFRACLCSILELPIEAVPNLHPDDPETLDWWKAWDVWLWENWRLRLTVFQPGNAPDHVFDTWYGIGNFRLNDEAKDFTHFCVVQGEDIVHNPWPGSDVDDPDLGELLETIFFVPATHASVDAFPAPGADRG